MGKVVVLVDQLWVGHCETQMKLFVQILFTRDCRIIVLCPRPQIMESWVSTVFPEFRDRFLAVFFAAADHKHFLRKILLWKSIRDSVRAVEKTTGLSVDRVFLAWLDGLFPEKRWQSPLIRYFMTYQWVGLYFLPSIYRSDIELPARSKKRKILRNCGLFKSKNCVGVGVLDEGSYAGLSKRMGNKPVVLVPDVTDEQLPDTDADSVAEIRRKAGGRPIIGLIGVLSPRKGVLNFLRLAATIAPDQCFFLLAGELKVETYPAAEQEELKRLLSLGRTDNCSFILEYVADPALFNALVNLSDILYLVYDRFFHSSGLLTKAAVFKKPVIVSKKYCMGKRVQEYKLGLAVSEGNFEEILEAVKYLIVDGTRETLIENAEFGLYHDANNFPMLEQALCKMLQL